MPEKIQTIKGKIRKPYTTFITYCPTGSKFHKTYEITVDELGHKTLKENGSTNTYAKIQEHLEETLIENILQRAALGDEEALNRVQSQYLDTTDMPKTLAEAQNKILSIKNEFEKLPVEIRREFDFSPEKYIQEYGTKSWMKTLGFIKEETADISAPVEKEEKANE